jgi:ferredoxin-NADP reductase
LQVSVINIKQETSDVKTFTFSTNDNTPLTYEAGQFITLISRHTGVEERRSYSFSSAPAAGEVPTITVKRIDNGILSRFLFDRVSVGHVFEALKPSGFFTLPDNIDNLDHLFFFAAGVGITPVFSLIKTALLLHPSLKITLVYSNRSISDTLFYDELEVLKHKHAGRFYIEYMFSTAANLTRARLSKTLMPVILKERAHSGSTMYYLCGPFPYMRMVILGLEEAGIPAEDIRKENFNTNVITKIVKPPDEDAHDVALLYGKKEYHFTSQYPDTILKSARKNHISLPYSCENGICGSCAALCTNGKVWHRNNEVLTDAELAKGMILTCVAYPVGGDVAIKLQD